MEQRVTITVTVPSLDIEAAAELKRIIDEVVAEVEGATVELRMFTTRSKQTGWGTVE